MLKASVLIPTYRRPQCIRECVESILSSDYQALEVIVLDQSPDDETERALAGTIDPRLIYLHLDVAGKSHAMNVGMARSAGDIVCLVDDDCMVGSAWAGVVVSEFERDPQLDILTGAVLPILLDPKAVSIATTTHKDRRVFERRRNPFGVSVGTNVAYRRVVMAKAGLFDENLGPGAKYRAVEDNEYFYRALKHANRVVYVPEMEMYHKQWRAEREAWARIDEYRVGSAAFIGKHLARFDPWPGIYYAPHPFRHLNWAVQFRRPAEVGELIFELRFLLPKIWESFWFYRRNGHENTNSSLSPNN